MIATRLTTEATPPPCHPSPGSTPRDRGRTWCAAASRDYVPPRSHAPGGGGNAGQATAPEAGEEAAGAVARHEVMDCLRGPGMWWFGFEAQVVHENAEGHRCCRRGMNCCCFGRTKVRPLSRTRAASLPGWGRGELVSSKRTRQHLLWRTTRSFVAHRP